MPAKKLNLSVTAQDYALIHAEAREYGVPVSRYVAGLAVQNARARRDALAAEGYRMLDADTRAFAEESLPTAAEGWPEWDESTHGASAAR